MSSGRTFTLLVSSFLAAAVLTTAVAGDGKGSRTRTPKALEIQCVDDSTFRATLFDEQIELVTPYGRLLIPAADVHKIEFATRLPDEVARKIETAINDLGHADYKRRHVASEELLAQQEKAYPALVQAAKGSDLEVVRRAEAIVQKIRETLPPERLETRTSDIVHTADSKISGKLTAASFRVKTALFGEQQMKLANVRQMSLPDAAPSSAGNALADPGTLGPFQNQVGQTLLFRVTGAPAGRGGVWGTTVYTMDSTLSVAAVHAGILRAGETGNVRVTIMGPVAGFQASTQNGISSSAYGQYAGYRVAK